MSHDSAILPSNRTSVPHPGRSESLSACLDRARKTWRTHADATRHAKLAVAHSAANEPEHEGECVMMHSFRTVGFAGELAMVAGIAQAAYPERPITMLIA